VSEPSLPSPASNQQQPAASPDECPATVEGIRTALNKKGSSAYFRVLERLVLLVNKCVFAVPDDLLPPGNEHHDIVQDVLFKVWIELTVSDFSARGHDNA
jgi:hypothetical protein